MGTPESRRVRSSFLAYRRARPFPALGFTIPATSRPGIAPRLPPSPVRLENPAVPAELLSAPRCVPPQVLPHGFDDGGGEPRPLVREFVEEARPPHENIVD